MGRRAEEPLEKKDIILFKGDWAELEAILAPRKVKPTVFIRHLVRKKILEIKERTNSVSRPTPELTDDDLDTIGLELTTGGESSE